MLLELIEDHYTYKPDRNIDPGLFPENSKTGVFQSAGQKLQYLFVKKEQRQIIIQCHGNAANLSTLGHFYEIYEKLGISYFVYDYPGYGQSEGRPSEEALYQSLDDAIGFVCQTLGYNLNQIILHGVSLGGAVAVNGLSKHSVACAVLDCTFTSNLDMARVIFPFIPLAKFMQPKFNSLAKISAVAVPTLFISAEKDTTCPAEMTERLYQAKPGIKELYTIAKAGHTDHLEVAGAEYLQRIKEFISKF